MSGFLAARGTAGMLALAAAPTFAAMAVWTGLAAGPPETLCVGAEGVAPLDGMTLMYLLMGAFHLPPWLALISPRQTCDRHP